MAVWPRQELEKRRKAKEAQQQPAAPVASDLDQTLHYEPEPAAAGHALEAAAVEARLKAEGEVAEGKGKDFHKSENFLEERNSVPVACWKEVLGYNSDEWPTPQKQVDDYQLPEGAEDGKLKEGEKPKDDAEMPKEELQLKEDAEMPKEEMKGKDAEMPKEEEKPKEVAADNLDGGKKSSANEPVAQKAVEPESQEAPMEEKGEMEGGFAEVPEANKEKRNEALKPQEVGQDATRLMEEINRMGWTVDQALRVLQGRGDASDELPKEEPVPTVTRIEQFKGKNRPVDAAENAEVAEGKRKPRRPRVGAKGKGKGRGRGTGRGRGKQRKPVIDLEEEESEEIEKPAKVVRGKPAAKAAPKKVGPKAKAKAKAKARAKASGKKTTPKQSKTQAKAPPKEIKEEEEDFAECVEEEELEEDEEVEEGMQAAVEEPPKKRAKKAQLEKEVRSKKDSKKKGQAEEVAEEQEKKTAEFKSFARRAYPKTSPARDKWLAIHNTFKTKIAPKIRASGGSLYTWEEPFWNMVVKLFNEMPDDEDYKSLAESCVSKWLKMQGFK